MGSGTLSFWTNTFFLGTWEGQALLVSKNAYWTGANITINTQGLWSLSMDEFRIWNRPLTQTEIGEAMFKPLRGIELGLLVYFPFNDGNETVAVNKALSVFSNTNPANWNGIFLDSRNNMSDPANHYKNSFQPSTYPIFVPSFVPSSLPNKTRGGLFSQRTVGRYNGFAPQGQLYGHACHIVKTNIWCISGANYTDAAFPTGIELIITYNITAGGWREVRPSNNAGKKFLFHQMFSFDDRFIHVLGGNVFQSANVYTLDTELEVWVDAPSNNVAQLLAGPLFAPGHALKDGLLWNFGGGDLGGTQTLSFVPNRQTKCHCPRADEICFYV